MTASNRKGGRADTPTIDAYLQANTAMPNDAVSPKPHGYGNPVPDESGVPLRRPPSTPAVAPTGPVILSTRYRHDQRAWSRTYGFTHGITQEQITEMAFDALREQLEPGWRRPHG